MSNITLTRCDGGGHVHVWKDGENVYTFDFDELVAGTAQAQGNPAAMLVQAAVTMAGATTLEGMQSAVEGL